MRSETVGASNVNFFKIEMWWKIDQKKKLNEANLRPFRFAINARVIDDELNCNYQTVHFIIVDRQNIQFKLQLSFSDQQNQQNERKIVACVMTLRKIL